MKQLPLALDWGELWESCSVVHRYEQQAWILSQLPVLRCGHWVQNSDGQIGKIYTVYPPEIYVETSWDGWGFAVTSTKWLLWNVKHIRKPLDLPAYAKLEPGIKAYLKQWEQIVEVISVTPITILCESGNRYRVSINQIEPLVYV